MGAIIRNNPAEVVARWQKAIQITAADAALAVNRQKTRILERTAKGLDVEGRAFAPYSRKGPYYHYPNGRAGSSFTDRQNKSAAARLFRALKPGGAPKWAGGIRKTRTGKGLVFDSYAAFKRWLGRTAVDLRGPRAPHMLQALVVKVAGAGAAIVKEARIGLYGKEAARADGHQRGTGRLPKRKFLGASADDRKIMIGELMDRIKARMGVR